MALTTEQKSINALKEDYIELQNAFNERYVTIDRVKPQLGDMVWIRITVNAPSHYLRRGDRTHPIPCDKHVFLIKVHRGYPKNKPTVEYDMDHRLASINVFDSGRQCTDEWREKTSSLFSLAKKTVLDIIHDPSVSRPDSPANRDLIPWWEEQVEAHRFPTISPSRVLGKRAPMPGAPNVIRPAGGVSRR